MTIQEALGKGISKEELFGRKVVIPYVSTWPERARRAAGQVGTINNDYASLLIKCDKFTLSFNWGGSGSKLLELVEEGPHDLTVGIV